MRLVAIIIILPFILFPLSSCDKNLEFLPWQCHCDIEVITLSKPSFVTYQVAAYDGASVSSVTYQTDSGQAVVDHPSLPFETTVLMEKGTKVGLVATGDPKKGNIILTYEIRGKEDGVHALSSSVSRVWVMKDGVCR